MLKIFIMMNSIVANTKEAKKLENSIDPELMAKFLSHDVFKDAVMVSIMNNLTLIKRL